jgi:uncharacterized protein YlxW (UPF0749 family)
MSKPTPKRRWIGRPAATAIIGVLTLILGFAIAVQVHANSSSDALSGLRDDDLIGILDNQNDRADRLRQQIAELEANLRQLQSSGDTSAAARRQATEEAQALGVLLGTVPASGPGVAITVTDPAGKLDGEQLLAVVEELRGAGAEAISVGPVRIGLSSAFTQDTPTSPIVVDGKSLTAPYVLLVIGDPPTLATAMNIPGGVVDTVRGHQGQTEIIQRDKLVIRALREVRAPQYAQPSPTPTN